MKTALALSALLLATPAMAGESLKTAAILAIQVDICGAKVDPGVVREIIVQGSVEENITIADAFNVTRGMQRAYQDIIHTLGTSKDYCAEFKRAGQ